MINCNFVNELIPDRKKNHLSLKPNPINDNNNSTPTVTPASTSSISSTPTVTPFSFLTPTPTLSPNNLTKCLINEDFRVKNNNWVSFTEAKSTADLTTDFNEEHGYLKCTITNPGNNQWDCGITTAETNLLTIYRKNIYTIELTAWADETRDIQIGIGQAYGNYDPYFYIQNLEITPSLRNYIIKDLTADALMKKDSDSNCQFFIDLGYFKDSNNITNIYFSNINFCTKSDNN